MTEQELGKAMLEMANDESAKKRIRARDGISAQLKVNNPLSASFLGRLSPASQKILKLHNAGRTKDEIYYAMKLTSRLPNLKRRIHDVITYHADRNPE
jgi:hypothetical protein